MAPRILVVDDDAGIRLMTTTALRQEGYEMVTSPNGVAGLEAAMREHFDLVVTNKSMPGMTGDELAWRIRTIYPDMPILHLGVQSLADYGGFPPGTYHLPKPFSLSELRRAVHKILDDHTPHPPRLSE